jgi:hypothetical protein
MQVQMQSQEMTMITFEAVGGLVLVVALTALAMWAFYRAGRETGYEEGRADAYAAALERRPAPGRHRVSQPRAALPLPPAAGRPVPARSRQPKPSRTGLVADARDSRGALTTVTAADIGEVFLPPQAAPSKHGAARTGTMPRVQLTAGATTGEIRAVGDELVAAIERGDLA